MAHYEILGLSSCLQGAMKQEVKKEETKNFSYAVLATTAILSHKRAVLRELYRPLCHYSQCAPCFSNPNQKVHGLFHFYITSIYKTDQNQLKKPSVIRVPKFTSIDMAEKCHQRPSFSIEYLFFEDYYIGTLMRDGFFN